MQRADIQFISSKWFKIVYKIRGGDKARLKFFFESARPF